MPKPSWAESKHAITSMPKPSWAENLEVVKVPRAAREALMAVTAAQWAWYREQGGQVCSNCNIRLTAERNYSRCGTCRQAWWPQPGKPGCELVTHLMDPTFVGGALKSSK
eukprot:SAG11_NODE_12440_length_701_cov_1.352649_1_plen_109_part_10